MIIAVNEEAAKKKKEDIENKKLKKPTNPRVNPPGFRSTMLKNFNDTCVVTSSRVEAVLEAAHIMNYSGPVSNSEFNGLLLRR